MAKPRLRQTTVSDVNERLYDRQSDERTAEEIATQVNRYLGPRGLPVPFSYVMNHLTGEPSLRNLRRYDLDKPGDSEEQLQDYDNIGTIDDPNLGKPKDNILQYSPDDVIDVLHALILKGDVFCLIDRKQRTEFPEHVEMLITVISHTLGRDYKYSDSKPEMVLISKENVPSWLKFIKLQKNGSNGRSHYKDDEG